MMNTDVIIIGGGPCGLAAGLSLKKAGIQATIIEKGNIAHTIYRYPTHQTFFSSADKLEIGGYPFVHEERKPRKIHALTYYREVVKRSGLSIASYETAVNIDRSESGFNVTSKKSDGSIIEYTCRAVVLATGYYDHPNMMNVPGEDLPHVFHYFKEGHPFFDKDIAVIGGKNSAIDTALELQKCGARPHVFYRGSAYSPSIKPWVLPDFEACVKNGQINMSFNSEVIEIRKDGILVSVNGTEKFFSCEYCFAMTGYHPDHTFLKKAGVKFDQDTGRPVYHPETMETSVHNVFIAGVIAAGNNANEIFIENGRFHGDSISACLQDRWNRT
ncbi:YpdA family putative bacillithiol disulfide reductase [Fictibacillus iocasae]|uniref:YpdA family putative bacillithiol disulfide reductase n=1 Tax=Fictibacillus iocasae TaxID=2715437 RepID=A0ABW2NMY7_9BACL